MIDYAEFLETKRELARPAGFEPVRPISERLYPFQRAIVEWALRRGRSAIFADCGLGKTPMQLEWADHVRVSDPDGAVLIVAPLGVVEQTVREGRKFGIEVKPVADQSQVSLGHSISITNYEKLHKFNPEAFSGIVLDESSILKSYEGATRRLITQFARSIPYRLACTATPAPNDLVELTNHSEFLDILSGKEVIALFFKQDGNSSNEFVLKGHAKEPFYRWLASWAVALRRPSDIGFDDEGYVLPELRLHQVTVDSRNASGLFAENAAGITAVRKARRDSLADRVRAVADLVNPGDEPWIVWCDLNAEADALAKAIPDAVEVRGSHSESHKVAALAGFSSGEHRVLIAKPSMFGWGMNWQHCSKMAFCGLGYSWEQYYQGIRRCYRFGQSRPVDVYVVASEAEGRVVETIARKERDASEMMDQLVRHMDGLSIGRAARDEMDYQPRTPMRIPQWLTGS